MPTSTEIICDGRGLRLVGWGVLTGSEMMEATAALEANPEAFRKLTFGLVALMAVAELKVTGDDIRSLAHMDRRLALVNSSLCVAVAASKGVVFGIARMWEVLAEPTGWATSIFRDLNDAEKWIKAKLANPDP